MTSSTPSPSQLSPLLVLIMSWAALISGMGLLLYELSTGVFYRSVPAYALWLIYLMLLLMSVWGMKALLEHQTEAYSRWSQRREAGGRTRRSTQATHNLFRLPAEGQIYVLMLTVMLLGALFGKTNTLMLVFALMAGPFIVNGGITFGMTRRLSLRRQLPRRIMLGEPASVDIIVQNRKRLISSSLISIEDRIVGPRQLLTGRLMFTLIPARSERTGRYQVRFMQRGRYELGPARITSRFPLGIVERGLQIEAYDEILVYPRIGHLAGWWLRRLTDGQETSRTTHSQSGAFHDEFHRIREYRHGDELRSIHWKTSARKNEMMVREYQQNRDRRLLLIVDLWELKPTTNNSPETSIPPLAIVEHAISLAATIAWTYLQQCGPQQLDFICYGAERWQWMGHFQHDQPLSLLDQLALAEPGRNYKRADIETEILSRQAASTRTMIITTRSPKEFLKSHPTDAVDANTILHGLQIIEAHPEQTQEFFQLEPIE